MQLSELMMHANSVCSQLIITSPEPWIFCFAEWYLFNEFSRSQRAYPNNKQFYINICSAKNI